MSTAIRWLPESTLRKNAEYAEWIYWSYEEDLSVCTEYIAPDEKHLGVYSFRLADLVIRIGPEILRLFELILFNPNRERSFTDVPGLKEEIMRIQKRRDEKKVTFTDYVRAISMAFSRYPLAKMCVGIQPLERYIVPFEAEKKKLGNDKEIDWFFWWENGYNALKHRVIEEFSTSATLKHVLFSLAGLWILHNLRNYDFMVGVLDESDFFTSPFNHTEAEYAHLGIEDKLLR